MTRTLSRAAVAVLAGALASQFARADLVVNDPFLTGTDPTAGQYDPTQFLNADLNNVQGYPDNSGYTHGAGTVQTHVVDGSLDTLGAGYETGGKVQFDGSPVDAFYRSNARLLATPYTSASANGPVYLGGMIRTAAFPDIAGDAGLRGYALFGFTSELGAFNSDGTPTAGTLGGYFLGFHANPDDSLDLIIRHRLGTTQGSSGQQEDIVVYHNASPSTTYQFLVKTDVNAANGNQEVVHYWINPTDVTSEATATSTALASGTFNDYSFQTPTDITRTTVATLKWDANVFFDEFRMGTTFADVAGRPVTGAPGDANVDGVVNGDDFALIDRGFAKHLIGWTNGDFNEDGVVDQKDYLLIDTAFAQQNGGQLSPALLAQRETQFGPAYVSSLIASVPEPTSLAACGLALLPLLSRRRRHA